MITTANSQWAEWMNSYKHFGMSNMSAAREGVCFERMGSNYKLSNIQAAVGLGQMQDIDMLLAERRFLAENYNALLGSVAEIELPVITKHGQHSWQTYAIRVDNRDSIMKNMRAQGVEVQIGSYALHAHPAFQSPSCRLHGDYPDSKAAFAKTLALPMYHGMSTEEQEIVVNMLVKKL